MDEAQKQLLKDVKTRFRALSPKDREKIGIALLKVNLGVNSLEERLLVENFLSGLPLELRTGKLDPLLNYLHSTHISPPEFSGWFAPAAVSTESSESGVSGSTPLPEYRADEVETLKEPVRPLTETKKG